MTEPIRRIGPLRRSVAPVPPITLRRVQRDDPEDREDREDAARQREQPRREAPPSETQDPPPTPGGHVDVQA